jgi:PhnB protein
MKSVITYLNFDGNCRDAMKFYQGCFGGELYLMPFSEAPGDFPKEAKDRVMHATVVKSGVGIVMASDTMPGQPFKQGTNFAVCVTPENSEELENLFKAFSEGAKVTMPLQDTFWGARFGMLTDQFGVNWMFNFEKPKQ